MVTAIKHPVPDRVKPPFVISHIQALWRSGLCQSARMTKITNHGLQLYPYGNSRRKRVQKIWVYVQSKAHCSKYAKLVGETTDPAVTSLQSLTRAVNELCESSWVHSAERKYWRPSGWHSQLSVVATGYCEHREHRSSARLTSRPCYTTHQTAGQ